MTRCVRAALAALITGLVVLAPAALRAAPAAPEPARLELASVQAAVARLDAEDGELLYGKNATRTVPIASVTKLLTALVVIDSGEDLDEWLTVVDREEPPPNNAYSRIRIGSELRRRDLMRIMLQASENLAAHVLSAHHPGGRAAFVRAMNAKAAELGMTGSAFDGPSGLSPRNLSTAADLVTLARAAYREPLIREYSTSGYYAARFRSPRYDLGYGQTNPLVGSSRWPVTLSKTGYLSESGRCLVMVVEIDGDDVIMVFLDSFGTRTPLGDAGRARRWLTTGDGGGVAGAAARYARERNAEYVSGERTVARPAAD
jgi:D-alanyl-D-alanine endopeptidase (penicillin-binding protein 7)